jgi:hypothetical protein
MPPAFTLARRYAEALAALRAIHDFDAWLGEHWQAIAWYESAEMVTGYLPGEEGCFQVRRDERLPDLPIAETFTPEYGRDVVIRAAMRDDFGQPGS